MLPELAAVVGCGRPIKPKLIESQIYGGVIQGVSYALYEERHLDPTSGLHLTANVDQYKIVGSREVPTIELTPHRSSMRPPSRLTQAAWISWTS